MPEPLVIQTIDEQRARLMAHEAATMREMAQRWMGVEDALKADMLELAMYLDELRLKGETISAARLLQMERYKALIAEARAEHEQYARWAANAVAEDQRQAVGQGIVDAQELIEAAGLDAKIARLAFDYIHTGAVEFMAGFAGDGTPLYDLLRASYPESVVKLTDALVLGLARGVGPRATAALMQQHMAGNLDRALLIARTEQLRALRAGSLEQMRQSKVVNGYIRRAQRNGQTCAACLALDGTVQKSEEVFKSHPACRCYAQPVLRFGKTPSFPSGPEWLAQQPESVQRSVLGKGKFELFKDGKLDWGQVAQVHDDPVWGPTIRQGTMGQVKQAIKPAKPARIDFEATTSQYIADFGNIVKHYSSMDPGIRYVIPRPVFYNSFGSAHLSDDEHKYRLKWLSENQDGLIRAIESPDFIEKDLRARKDGFYSATLITELRPGTKSEDRFMVVAISLGLDPKDGYHQITTIYPSSWKAIFNADGTLKVKYVKLNKKKTIAGLFVPFTVHNVGIALRQ